MSKFVSSLLRTFPDFKGKRRLAHLLLGESAKKGTNIKVAASGGNYVLPNIQEPVAFDIYINGIYEADIHRFLLKRLPQGSTLLDLGANIGSIAIPLCRKRADLHAVCVEASPWVYSYLTQNVQLNNLGNQVRTLNNAVFDKDNEQLPFYAPKKLFGKGSLSPVYTSEPEMVKSITIETLMTSLGLSQVGIIKIDIEGYESVAFKGAERLLKSAAAPDILFEFVDWAEKNAGFNPGAAQTLLKEWGYSLYSVDNEKVKPLDQVLIQGGAMILASKK